MEPIPAHGFYNTGLPCSQSQRMVSITRVSHVANPSAWFSINTIILLGFHRSLLIRLAGTLSNRSNRNLAPLGATCL